MNTLATGKKFPEFYRRPEGAYFVADDSGILLVYNYRMPTEKELNAVKADKPAEFRFLIENDAFFFLSKFGGLSWNDSPFNPLLNREFGYQPPTDPAKGYLMTFVMVDAASNIIKHIRVIGLGHDFSVKLCDTLNSFFDREENAHIESKEKLQEINDRRVALTYDLYTSDQLARRATTSYRIKAEG